MGANLGEAVVGVVVVAISATLAFLAYGGLSHALLFGFLAFILYQLQVLGTAIYNEIINLRSSNREDP